MSITPQFLDELRARVPISDVVGRFVTWDQKKSRPAQGDHWAPCPFHSEKTASFHADDRKGYYYCFGCHQKGDAISFLREKENLGFVDAVRELADMAGMEMPKLDPRAKEKSDAHAKMIEMQEAAARFFSRQLHSSAGAQAMDYLTSGRGLSHETINEFGLGYSPNARDMLLSHLREAGFTDQEIVEAGLALKPDDGGAPFDRFRNRIMFPIHDNRGRVIAFGGRAMDANAKAKYLNSADSPIFHKGKVVYNLHRARSALEKDASLVVAEGYMDVIALHQADIKTAIAPLGTAVTLDQLGLLWRVHPAPILALDGDEAGQRAAARAANLALPQLTATQSLRFAILPEGVDPDDFIKKNGAQAMRALLRDAVPMVDMLWRDALGDAPLETPEARAAFDSRLKALLNQIQDPSLRNHYDAEFRTRRKALWESAFQSRGNKKSPTLARGTSSPKLNPNAHQDFRAALILRTILTYPQFAKRLTDDLAHLKCPNPTIDKIRKEVILAYGDKAAIEGLATKDNLESLEFGHILRHLSFFHEDDARAYDISSKELSRASAQAQAQSEISEIMRDIQNSPLTEDKELLLKNAVLMRDEAQKIMDIQVDDAEDDRAFLRQFLESEGWRK